LGLRGLWVVVNYWSLAKRRLSRPLPLYPIRSGRIAMRDEVAFTDGWLHIRDDVEGFLGDRQ